jgi:NTE family protein
MTNRVILVLGGGAPNLTLMSGALAAFHDNGCTYDVISMAGAGAVVGACYLAPKGLTPREALWNTMSFGVSDAIYSLFPINYKIFNKGGPFAARFRDYLKQFPEDWRARHQYGMNPTEHLEADLFEFGAAMATPSNLNYFSQAECAHMPFIEDVVDFDSLQRRSYPKLYLNAYNITWQRPEEFENHQLDVHHFRAALSFPFLYAPYKIGDDLYYEGAAFSCLNLTWMAVNKLQIPNTIAYNAQPDASADKFILFDILPDDLIHPARDLWDAYTQSIILPLVSDAAKEQAIFKLWVNTGQVIFDRNATLPNPSGLRPNVKEFPVLFDNIPTEQWPYILDWSRSNMERLFDIGYEAGLSFLQLYYDDIWV